MSEDYAGVLATHALRIGAIKLSPQKPFQWASGYFMPIYNDNRMLLGDLQAREHVVDGLLATVRTREGCEVIAGTSTAGIPWASFVAGRLQLPMIYVRDKPKDHGLKNQIEGIDAEKDLGGRRVLLIEDLVSTGGSSAKAVQAIRDAKGSINTCACIFNYDLDEAREMFMGEKPFDQDRTLRPCLLTSLLKYQKLIAVAEETGYINEEQAEMLEEWRMNPFKWGERRGFPPVKRQNDK
ncbi:MAG: orotate phosphoribosyltransferase [Nanoarchaeota archaeon]